MGWATDWSSRSDREPYLLCTSGKQQCVISDQYCAEDIFRCVFLIENVCISFQFQ